MRLNGTAPEVHTNVSRNHGWPSVHFSASLVRHVFARSVFVASLQTVSANITSFLYDGLVLRGTGSSSGAPHHVGEPKRVECGAQRQQPGDLPHPVQGNPPLKRGAEFLPR
jgi:hypothetical protein